MSFSFFKSSALTVSHSNTLSIAKVSSPTTLKIIAVVNHSYSSTYKTSNLPLVLHAISKYVMVFVIVHLISFVIKYFCRDHFYRLTHIFYHKLTLDRHLGVEPYKKTINYVWNLHPTMKQIFFIFNMYLIFNFTSYSDRYATSTK